VPSVQRQGEGAIRGDTPFSWTCRKRRPLDGHHIHNIYTRQRARARVHAHKCTHTLNTPATGDADRAADNCQRQHYGVLPAVICSFLSSCVLMYCLALDIFFLLCILIEERRFGPPSKTRESWKPLRGSAMRVVERRLKPPYLRSSCRVPFRAVAVCAAAPEAVAHCHSPRVLQVPGTYLCQSCINDQPQSTDWKVISCLNWEEGCV
jgi:hypothetical protein